MVANRSTSFVRRRIIEARALPRLGSLAEVASVASMSSDSEHLWAAIRRLPRRQAQVTRSRRCSGCRCESSPTSSASPRRRPKPISHAHGRHWPPRSNRRTSDDRSRRTTRPRCHGSVGSGRSRSFAGTRRPAACPHGARDGGGRLGTRGARRGVGMARCTGRRDVGTGRVGDVPPSHRPPSRQPPSGLPRPRCRSPRLPMLRLLQVRSCSPRPSA